MAYFGRISAQDLRRWPEKSPQIRRTLASPNLATSSKSPAAMRGEVLSASMRIANRRVRLSSGMFEPPLFVPEKGHQYTSAIFDLAEQEPIWTGNCEVGRSFPP